MIKNPKHICYILRTKESEIEDIVKNIDDYYDEMFKFKENRDGSPVVDANGKLKKRILHPSTGRLKEIQYRVHNEILVKLFLPSYFYGGVKKKDNIRNARLHQGKKFIFTTDLKNFFPSIRHREVFQMFMDNDFSPTVSRWLTQLTTFRGCLPQGTHTSPLIANLVFKKTGEKLTSFCNGYNITFTTFVDDLTFSSPNDFKDYVPEILSIIRSDGYRISHKKTNYRTKNPIVTGVVVRNNNLSLPDELKEELRCSDELTDAQRKGIENYAYRIGIA